VVLTEKISVALFAREETLGDFVVIVIASLLAILMVICLVYGIFLWESARGLSIHLKRIQERLRAGAVNRSDQLVLDGLMAPRLWAALARYAEFTDKLLEVT